MKTRTVADAALDQSPETTSSHLMNDTQLFAFESDFVSSLRCIPMAVRLKFDRCAIKVTLRQWSRLSRQDRQTLLDTPCATRPEIEAYRTQLVGLIAARAREDAKPLLEPPLALIQAGSEAPPDVATFARSVGVAPPTTAEWRDLTELQRFVLIKLTRDGHDNVNFIPAMREFGLAGR